jgi:hypothetical protein
MTVALLLPLAGSLAYRARLAPGAISWGAADGRAAGALHAL